MLLLAHKALGNQGRITKAKGACGEVGGRRTQSGGLALAQSEPFAHSRPPPFHSSAGHKCAKAAAGVRGEEGFVRRGTKLLFG